MTDSKDDKTLDNEGKKTLKLKPSGVSQGTVRQDMGRGRSKAVVVETRKRRIHKPGEDNSASASRAPASQSAQPRQGETRRNDDRPTHQPKGQPSRPGAQNRQRGGQPDRGNADRGGQNRQRGNVLHDLSQGEMDARRRALVMAQQREAEDAERRKREAEEARIAEEKAKREAEEKAKREAEEAKARAAEPAPAVEETPAEAEAPVVPDLPPGEDAKPSRTAQRPRPAARTTEDDDDAARGRKPRREGESEGGPARGKALRPDTAPKPASRPKGTGERRRGKLTVTAVTGDDEGGSQRGRSLSAMRRRQE
ncbi:MAG: translation initiation factor IF-2 associated domain-containing protein, partial [Martelella sp.]